MKLGNIFLLTLLLSAYTVSAEIPAGYYDACVGKKQSALKSQLYAIIKNHDKISYGKSGTWNAFRDTDVRSAGPSQQRIQTVRPEQPVQRVLRWISDC